MALPREGREDWWRVRRGAEEASPVVPTREPLTCPPSPTLGDLWKSGQGVAEGGSYSPTASRQGLGFRKRGQQGLRRPRACGPSASAPGNAPPWRPALGCVSRKAEGRAGHR